MSEQLGLAILQLIALVLLGLINRQQGKRLTAKVEEASRPTPETVETNGIVKQMLASQDKAQEGWGIALQVVRDQNAKLTDQVMALQGQNGALRQKLESSSLDIDKLLDEQLKRADASQKNKEQIDALTRKVAEMEQGQAKIAQELQAAQAELADAKRLLAEQIDLVSRLEQQLAEERAAKERIAQERDTALAKVRELERRIADLESQVKELEAKLGIQHEPPMIEVFGAEITDGAIKTPLPGTLHVVEPPAEGER